MVRSRQCPENASFHIDSLVGERPPYNPSQETCNVLGRVKKTTCRNLCHLDCCPFKQAACAAEPNGHLPSMQPLWNTLVREADSTFQMRLQPLVSYMHAMQRSMEGARYRHERALDRKDCSLHHNTRTITCMWSGVRKDLLQHGRPGRYQETHGHGQAMQWAPEVTMTAAQTEGSSLVDCSRVA